MAQFAVSVPNDYRDLYLPADEKHGDQYVRQHPNGSVLIFLDAILFCTVFVWQEERIMKSETHPEEERAGEDAYIVNRS